MRCNALDALPRKARAGRLFERIIAEKIAHTPKEGFAVVGVDEYGGDGLKSLYTVAQCATLEEAREARLAAIKEGLENQNQDEMLIFDSAGRSLD